VSLTTVPSSSTSSTSTSTSTSNPPTTVPTTTTSTSTSTTLPECTPTSPCPPGELCVDGTCVPDEICGNCLDDDGDGLTDAEDPACCGDDLRSSGTLQHGLLKPRSDGTTKLRLKATLGGSELAVDPPREDVSLLVRADGQAPLCVKLPAGSFSQHGRRFRYKGPKHETDALKRVVIPVKDDGAVRYKALGPSMTFPIDAAATELAIRITVGFQNPDGSPTTGRCSTMTGLFRKRGRAYKAKGS
jgi:hypothetical protein